MSRITIDGIEGVVEVTVRFRVVGFRDKNRIEHRVFLNNVCDVVVEKDKITIFSSDGESKTIDDSMVDKTTFIGLRNYFVHTLECYYISGDMK